MRRTPAQYGLRPIAPYAFPINAAAMSNWWQTCIIYQIYPRSFADANGDGVGDLNGIRARLPYLAELGIDAVWFSPIFPSPMADFGYDISDYTGIDPVFGTLAEFDALLEAAHGHGLKLLLDLVPNHTSDRHPWFTESRAARENPKRDWYIWKDPAPGGGPPNNWLSEFGGGAWEYDEQTKQYYCHTFLAAQPDLNWRNPAVRRAIHDVMRFWLKRGVDGFRVDVIWHLIKDEQFRDNPPDPAYDPGQGKPKRALIPLYTADRPEVHDVIREMRNVVDEFPDRLLIGEIYLPIERLVAYYGRDLAELHLPFNFALLNAPWQARTIAKLIDEYERQLPPGGWPNWVLGNHDRPRIASRVGAAQAPVAAMLLLTLRGTPTVYYGDEIGMQQVEIPDEAAHDPVAHNLPGLGLGRDGCRTPMQWDAGRYAGFSKAEPWLPLETNYQERNVAALQADDKSLYQLHRRLIALRRQHPALQLGSYRPLAASGDILAFVREAGDERILVALNMGPQPAEMNLPAGHADGRLLLSTFCDRAGERVSDTLRLRGNEGVIVAP
jgi:alpha-glucosidase